MNELSIRTLHLVFILPVCLSVIQTTTRAAAQLKCREWQQFFAPIHSHNTVTWHEVPHNWRIGWSREVGEEKGSWSRILICVYVLYIIIALEYPPGGAWVNGKWSGWLIDKCWSCGQCRRYCSKYFFSWALLGPTLHREVSLSWIRPWSGCTFII